MWNMKRIGLTASGEDVWKLLTTDDGRMMDERRVPSYTISSLMSIASLVSISYGDKPTTHMNWLRIICKRDILTSLERKRKCAISKCKFLSQIHAKTIPQTKKVKILKQCNCIRSLNTFFKCAMWLKHFASKEITIRTEHVTKCF